MTTYSDAITIVHRLKVWIADERMGDGALLKAAADLIERQAAELAALRAQLAERKCERLIDVALHKFGVDLSAEFKE